MTTKSANKQNKARTARQTSEMSEAECDMVVDAIIARQQRDGLSREQFIEQSFAFLAWRIGELEKRIKQLED